ncbi:MAG: DUF6090 family protein, partial [Longimicrobiales bacterium]
MFPRKASWTTMVSEGQLAVLGAPDLIGRLANLYEHSNVRLEYNGDRYDDTTQDLLRSHLPYVWDFNGRRLLADDAASIRTFASMMLQVQRQNRVHDGVDLVADALELRQVVGRVDLVPQPAPAGEGVGPQPAKIVRGRGGDEIEPAEGPLVRAFDLTVEPWTPEPGLLTPHVLRTGSNVCGVFFGVFHLVHEAGQ